MFLLEAAHFQNFRGFEDLLLSFEPDLTILFAENGGGKTAVLTALAIGLAAVRPHPYVEIRLDPRCDVRRIRGADGRRERAGTCTLAFTASIAGRSGAQWCISARPETYDSPVSTYVPIPDIHRIHEVGRRWPLLAYQSSEKIWNRRQSWKESGTVQDRVDGYAGSLDPSETDVQFLLWLDREAHDDLQRERRNEPQRHLASAVLDAIRRATLGVTEIRYDPDWSGPVTRFEGGQEVPWSELSDGLRLFMGRIGRIARRAVILNGDDGPAAPLLVEGVVLIDDIDLHLHPRWQRAVLDGLRAAFPKIQFIVTTHSPLVLSSAKNRQVRGLVDGKVKEGGVLVEGRGASSILHEVMGGSERDDSGRTDIQRLCAAIDEGRIADAQAQLASLRERWTKQDQAQLDHLRDKELAGTLAEPEAGELAALLARIEAEEARVLAPATARLRAEVEETGHQLSRAQEEKEALARLLSQQQSLADDARRFLAELDQRQGVFHREKATR